jgi:hypothetical protein
MSCDVAARGDGSLAKLFFGGRSVAKKKAVKKATKKAVKKKTKKK